MKKINILFLSSIILLSIVASCSSEQIGQSNKENIVDAATDLVTFESSDDGLMHTLATISPTTRTMITHKLGKGATPFWSSGDLIYVKNISGNFLKSGVGKFNGKMTRGTFTLSGTFTNGCTVNYVGTTSDDGTKVNISKTQKQDLPNNFSHAGASGDCGTASASGKGKSFSFKLTHKAAYLCFLPRCTNGELAQNISLTKIVVKSSNNIAGTYDFAKGKLSKDPVSNGSKTITLTVDKFPLTTVTSLEKNASYMVIAPGSHNLTIDYYIKDPITKVEESISQNVSTTFKEGNIYDITVNLMPTIYDDGKYYMWDAQKDYWAGHESDQPKTIGGYNKNYPRDNSDSRWYNEIKGYMDPYGTAPAIKATNTAANCPNVNEFCWYAKEGDPHWDNSTLWATMGHLYIGGMWLKKKAHIPGFTSSNAFNGIDYTTVRGWTGYNNTKIRQGKPTNLSHYFFLPAFGNYDSGRLRGLQGRNHFWSSTPFHKATNFAFSLYITRSSVSVDGTFRHYGFRLFSSANEDQYRPNGL